MKTNTENLIIATALVLLIGLILGATLSEKKDLETNYEENSTTLNQKSKANNSSSSSNILKHQTFPEYQFAIKCPAILKDASKQSNDDFEFNYAGGIGDTFYQIMIVRVPAGRKDMTKEQYKSFLKETFGKQGSGKHVLWGEEELPAYLLDDYIQNGYKGRGIAVARNGMIYTFNIMAKDNIDSKFNSFTNNVIFFNRSQPKKQASISSSQDDDWNSYWKAINSRPASARTPSSPFMSGEYTGYGNSQYDRGLSILNDMADNGGSLENLRANNQLKKHKKIVINIILGIIVVGLIIFLIKNTYQSKHHENNKQRN